MSNFKTRRLLWNFMQLTDDESCRHAQCKSLRHHCPKIKRLFIKEKRIFCIVELHKTRDSRKILIILLLVLRFSLTTLVCFQTHITRQFELGRHVDDSFNNQSATYCLILIIRGLYLLLLTLSLSL